MREDMATDSVSEVWVVVYRGLPCHTVHEEAAGGVGGQEGLRGEK